MVSVYQNSEIFFLELVFSYLITLKWKHLFYRMIVEQGHSKAGHLVMSSDLEIQIGIIESSPSRMVVQVLN